MSRPKPGAMSGFSRATRMAASAQKTRPSQTGLSYMGLDSNRCERRHMSVN